MSTISIVILFVIASASLLLIAQPLITRKARGIQASEEMLNDYEFVLATIRDLDEDFNTGKVSAETYERERAFWTERGIAMLQELVPDADASVAIKQRVVDALDTPSDTSADKPARTTTATPDDDQLDAIIEQAISSYRSAKVKA